MSNIKIHKKKDYVIEGILKKHTVDIRSIYPLKIEWDINYHNIQCKENIMCGKTNKVKYHLGKIVECMAIKIIKDHCE